MKKHLNYPYWRHKILPSALQILYRPWLISLGLHGLLLIMPLPDHPLSESPKPQSTVRITDLSVSPKQSTKPSSKSASTPKPTSSNASIPPQNTVIPTRSPEPTPSATPKPTPSATPTPEPTTPATETPGVKIKGGELEKFLGELTANNEMPTDKASKPSPDLFAEPHLFFDQLGSEPKPKSGIFTMRLINGKTPVQVQVQVLSSQGTGRNFQVSELGKYGGGTVYRVQQESGILYFNLVPTTGPSNGTVVVVWKDKPEIKQVH